MRGPDALRSNFAAMEPLALAQAPSTPAGNSRPVMALPLVTTTERFHLATLFHAEESGLLRFALGLVGRRSVAEDLVQEAFFRLHQVRDEVENPRAWLYRCVRNLALNHLRDRKPESDLATTTLAAESSLPAEQLGREEAIGLVRMLLAEMSEEDRALIQLKYLDELKYQEISRRTGLSVSNVGYRLHHLLKGLADGLRRAGIDGSEG